MSVNKSTQFNTPFRDKITMAIEVSKRSGVPVLFFSNPGYGKTTNVASFARITGRHVEELIISQYAQDELLGFQSKTDKSYLEIYEPEWYHRIMAYNEPHYEKISSGQDYELVEEDDVKKWKTNIEKYYSELEETKEELKNKKSRLSKISKKLEKPEILEQEEIKTLNSELEMLNLLTNTLSSEINRITSRIEKTKSLLSDIEWRPRRSCILFLDELSTASPKIQGAALNLCFNKRIRGGKKIPDDCLIVSAANYKGNLPGFSDIISPQLNRFLLVNLLPDSDDGGSSKYGLKIIDEFLQDFKEVDTPIRSFRTDFIMNEQTQKTFLSTCRSEFKHLINSYSNEGNSRITLDFRNVSFDDVYDRDDGIPEVYNFMSPRSLSYYIRIVRALCEMGVTEDDKDIYNSFVDGVLGLGTNNFNKDDPDAYLAQLKDFQESIYGITSTLIKTFQRNTKVSKKLKQKEIEKSDFINPDSITGMIDTIIHSYEKGIQLDTKSMSSLLAKLSSRINSKFNMDSPEDLKKYFESLSVEEAIQFRSDYNSLQALCEFLSSMGRLEFNQLRNKISEVLENFNFYYNNMSIWKA